MWRGFCVCTSGRCGFQTSRLDRQCLVLNLIQPADLLLWDSRTVHCNTPALSQHHFFSLPADERLRQAAAQPRELIRLCSYVCMVPRSHATRDELRSKVIMFSNRHDPLPCPPLPCSPPHHPLSPPVFLRPTGPHTPFPSCDCIPHSTPLPCPRFSVLLLGAHVAVRAAELGVHWCYWLVWL
jgi:hypothetical protein